MNNTKTGGPAFPVQLAEYRVNDGMTLRDYFAAKAIQGLLAGYTKGVPPADITAAAAYSYADAMLKAREA